MTTLDGIPLFKGKVQLLRWLDSSSAGKTVTFALDIDSAPDSHPFKGLGTGKYGQEFMLVAVPITSGGEPIPPGATTGAAIGSAAADHLPPPERSAAPGGAKRERTLPEKVGMLCNDKSFQAWALEYAVGQGWSVGEAPADCSGANREEVVTAIVRKACGVTSRKQILPGTEAAFKWNGIVCEFEAATNRMAEERRR